jgi:hypothetical protein
MSEYQYYAFQAIDRPLDRAAQQELRKISSRAQITAASFTNHYEWGDLKGDPRNFMERWFDLHLYVANWGARRLMLRLPKRFFDLATIDPFLREVDWVKVWNSGQNTIIDMYRDEVEPDDEWDDGTGWLAALAPLRGDVLSGDLRLFYLLWLSAVQDDLIADDDVEPLPGLGPLSGSLETFAEFFDIDPDLVDVAAECGAGDATISADALGEALAAISEPDKTELLRRLVEGDAHVAAELKSRIRNMHPAPAAPLRTVGALRKQAQDIAAARQRAEVERREAERRRQAEEAEKVRRARFAALRQRGDAVWRQIEEEIGQRNPSGYDRALNLLLDLQALAKEDGSQDDFDRRLADIRARHERKGNFIARLAELRRARDTEAS